MAVSLIGRPLDPAASFTRTWGIIPKAPFVKTVSVGLQRVCKLRRRIVLLGQLIADVHVDFLIGAIRIEDSLEPQVAQLRVDRHFSGSLTVSLPIQAHHETGSVQLEKWLI